MGDVTKAQRHPYLCKSSWLWDHSDQTGAPSIVDTQPDWFEPTAFAVTT